MKLLKYIILLAALVLVGCSRPAAKPQAAKATPISTVNEGQHAAKEITPPSPSSFGTTYLNGTAYWSGFTPAWRSEFFPTLDLKVSHGVFLDLPITTKVQPSAQAAWIVFHDPVGQ